MSCIVRVIVFLGSLCASVMGCGHGMMLASMREASAPHIGCAAAEIGNLERRIGGRHAGTSGGYVDRVVQQPHMRCDSTQATGPRAVCVADGERQP